jgi:hypothetical protein
MGISERQIKVISVKHLSAENKNTSKNKGVFRLPDIASAAKCFTKGETVQKCLLTAVSE